MGGVSFSDSWKMKGQDSKVGLLLQFTKRFKMYFLSDSVDYCAISKIAVLVIISIENKRQTPLLLVTFNDYDVKKSHLQTSPFTQYVA